MALQDFMYIKQRKTEENALGVLKALTAMAVAANVNINKLATICFGQSFFLFISYFYIENFQLV